MEIIWDVNPLKSKVLLTDHEKEIFRYKVIIEDYENLLFFIYCDREDPDKVKHWASRTYDPRNPDVDEMFNCYIHDLEEGYHVGDCTAVAMSCSKCHAEDMLGITTIPNMTKSIGHQLLRNFDMANNHLDVVETFLAAYDDKTTLKYLKNYLKEHNLG